MAAMFDLARERGEIGSDIPAEELARLTQVIFLGVTLSWAMNPDSSLRKTTEAVWNLISPSFSPAACNATASGVRELGAVLKFLMLFDVSVGALETSKC